MPCLEVTLPAISRATREALAARLTEAFCAATGHAAEVFGIRFSEYAAGEAALGGRLVDASARAPYVHAVLFCPRLTRAAKQRLATGLTEAFVTATGNAEWKPTVHLSEHPYDNIIVDGRLLSDAYAECAARAFYFELPRD